MVNICIRKKRKRHVFRDTASKLKKKNDHVVKVGNIGFILYIAYDRVNGKKSK